MRGQYRLRQIKHSVQDFLYHSAGLEEVEQRAEQQALSDAMGFAPQWEAHRQFQMGFLKQHGLTPSMRFLEIGCGPMTLGLPLIEYLDRGNYTGIDVRSSVMALAYIQLGKHQAIGKNPRLIVSKDFGNSEIGDERFDVIWSFSVLFHLEDALLTQLFEMVARRLEPDGRFWANINAEAPESRWLEFPFMKRDPEFYAEAAAKAGLRMTNLGTLLDNGLQIDGDEIENILLQFERA